MDKLEKYKYSKVYGHMLNWIAFYEYGKILKEFNNRYDKNDFYAIQQDDVELFGLYGKGNSYYFEKDGKLILNRKLLKIDYENNGKIHRLTENNFPKDLITFKKAYVEYDRQNGTKEEVSDGIALGYKYKYERDDLEMFVQIIVHIPFSSRGDTYVEVKLTPNQSLNGKLVMSNEIKRVKEIDAPVLQGYAGQVNWVIDI